MHFLSRAEAVLSFSIDLGLITLEESIDIVDQFRTAHPDFPWPDSLTHHEGTSG